MIFLYFSTFFLKEILCANTLSPYLDEHYYNFLNDFPFSKNDYSKFTLFSEIVLLNSYTIPSKNEQKNILIFFFNDLINSLMVMNSYILKDHDVDYSLVKNVLFNLRIIINYYFRIGKIPAEKSNKIFLDDFFMQLSLVYSFDPSKKSDNNAELVFVLKMMFEKVTALNSDYLKKSSMISCRYLNSGIYFD